MKPRIKNTINHPTRGRLVCRIWDNQGETLDRYTIAFKGYRNANWLGLLYPYLGCNSEPFHGIGYHGESYDFMTGKHLGKRVSFESLPVDVQRFIMQNI